MGEIPAAAGAEPATYGVAGCAPALTLIANLEAWSPETSRHSKAVARYALAVGRHLGLGRRDLGQLMAVGLLHDVGKVAVPRAILETPGPLGDDDWAIVRHHAVAGAALVATIPELQDLAPMIRSHHERWDGEGYPDRLAGEQIPVASRIVLACDAYDAMTTRRPYRDPLSPEDALAELAAGRGRQFWPAAVDALKELLATGLPSAPGRVVSSEGQPLGQRQTRREAGAQNQGPSIAKAAQLPKEAKP